MDSHGQLLAPVVEKFNVEYASCKASDFRFERKTRRMMAVMIFLSFLIAYPIIMLLTYLLARVIFTPLDKIAEEQQRERTMLLQKARRVRKRERQFVHA